MGSITILQCIIQQQETVVEGGENVVELLGVIGAELAELDDELLADVRGHAAH